MLSNFADWESFSQQIYESVQILLEGFLDPLALTQAGLARAPAIPLNRVNELVRGKRGITPETALLLAGYFKNFAEFWMNSQTAHDLTRARSELPKRHRLAAL